MGIKVAHCSQTYQDGTKGGSQRLSIYHIPMSQAVRIDMRSGEAYVLGQENNQGVSDRDGSEEHLLGCWQYRNKARLDY